MTGFVLFNNECEGKTKVVFEAYKNYVQPHLTYY